MQENIDLERMRIYVRKFYKDITYMQKRIRDQMTTADAKVEVLLNYWDKMFGQIQGEASKKKDQAVKDLCPRLITVPK